MAISDVRPADTSTDGSGGRPGDASRPAVGAASFREDLIGVLLAACLIGGALADGWAHANIVNTIEGFFTPWHGLLYGGFAGTAGWTLWLAYRRRDVAPRWWRDGWPAGYRLGGIGVVAFGVGGFFDMIWHETLGIEVGLNAAFSPSHMLIDIGAVLLVTSPLRSWWASAAGGPRAATGVASLTLGTMATTILLSHSTAFLTLAPTRPYDPAIGASNHLAAVAGVDAYLITTIVLTIPVLLAHRRRTTPGTATAVTTGVALFVMVMFSEPTPQVWAAFAAVGGAAVADVVLVRLDAVRGVGAPLRMPIAGAVFAAAVWTGHLLGLALGAGLRWPPELWAGIVTLTAILGALLGGLAARPTSYGPS